MTQGLDLVNAACGIVNALGGKFMLDADTTAAGKEAGFANGFVTYVYGRGGPLGDGDAAVVASTFGFFAPSLISVMWDRGIPTMPARDAGHFFAGQCFAWGRKHFDGLSVDDLATFADLGDKVIDAADGTGLTLFAAWRTEPRPPDPPARAMLTLNVLRELRGSAHLVAVLATGLSPRDAVLLHGGSVQGRQFGWGDDLEVPDHLRGLMSAAEELTDRLVTPAYSVLSDAEGSELVRILQMLKTHLSAG